MEFLRLLILYILKVTTKRTKKINKNDGKIKWNDRDDEIIRKVRAYDKWPGTFTFWNKKRVKIIDVSEQMVGYEEGCLSLPKNFAEVIRPQFIKVFYTDVRGNNKTLKAEGLLSTCIQHEIDHLNGITIHDREVKLEPTKVEKKIGRNQLVTIKKGDAVKVLKYKKAQNLLNQGWVME